MYPAHDDASGDAIRDAVVFRDATDYSLSLPDVYAEFQKAGIERSLRTLQRYCDQGHLRAAKYPSELGDVWYVDPDSVAVKIEEIRQIQSVKERQAPPAPSQDVAPHRGATADTAAASDDDAGRQANDDAVRRPLEHQPTTDATGERQPTSGNDARTVTLPVAVLDALTDQLRVKDEQLKRRDDELSKLVEMREGDQQLLLSAFSIIHRSDFELPSEHAEGDAAKDEPTPAQEHKPIAQSRPQPSFTPRSVENSDATGRATGL